MSLSVPAADTSPCQQCGACCSYSNTWPRFSTEDDAEIARIPARLIDRRGAGMACIGERCAALEGEIGVETRCRVYAVRPHVCRACEPGDEACRIARQWFGLAWPIPAV